MSQELNISISPEGAITRDEDSKLLANVNLETGEIKYANAAYAKGNYKEAIGALAQQAIASTSESGTTAETEPEPSQPEVAANEEPVAQMDPRVPSAIPPRDKALGNFSAAHINYDHANLSEKDFAAKYKSTAACQLEFMAYRPELFADREALEARFASLAKA